MDRIIQDAKRRLEQRRKSLLALLGSRPPDRGDVHDVADLASDEEAAQGEARDHARESRELREIAAALARIAAGTWDRCIQCGSAIGRSRLQALPEATSCLACSERLS